MEIIKTFKSTEELEGQVILKTTYSDDKITLGIRTSGGVIFLRLDSNTAKIEIVTDAYLIEKEILKKLNIEFGLIAGKELSIKK